MSKFSVKLRVEVDVSVEVSADDDRAAWEVARRELARRWVAAGLNDSAELRIGRYAFPVALSRERLRDAEIIDVEEMVR